MEVGCTWWEALFSSVQSLTLVAVEKRNLYTPEEGSNARPNPNGTILIKDRTLLPDALQLESEPCATGWRLVKNLDAHGLDRKVRDAGWNFFYQAGEVKTIVFGVEGQDGFRKAVSRILARLKKEKFNSLQFTGIVSKRFLGMPYVSVTVHSRHIQESNLLFRGEEVEDREPGHVGIRRSLVTGFTSGKPSRREKVTQLPAATI